MIDTLEARTLAPSARIVGGRGGGGTLCVISGRDSVCDIWHGVGTWMGTRGRWPWTCPTAPTRAAEPPLGARLAPRPRVWARPRALARAGRRTCSRSRCVKAGGIPPHVCWRVGIPYLQRIYRGPLCGISAGRCRTDARQAPRARAARTPRCRSGKRARGSRARRARARPWPSKT